VWERECGRQSETEVRDLNTEQEEAWVSAEAIFGGTRPCRLLFLHCTHMGVP
jgi:hypothetical protein